MFSKFIAAIAALILVSAAAQADADTRLAMNIGGRTVHRVSHGLEQWAYQWPAIYFEGRFRGDAVALKFDDPANNFNLLVDGRTVLVVRRPGRKVVRLSNLGPGAHVVRLEKRTETRDDVGAFAGFFVAQAVDALPALTYRRYIEFIGDSLTVGYGNLSQFTHCSKEELFEATDTQQAFGPLVAKYFHAEYRINAFSGLGMVRNARGQIYPQYHMPMLWRRVLFSDPAPDRSRWSPQIVVIGVGGNDFSPPFGEEEPWRGPADLAAEYERAYAGFVRSVRTTYPTALIVMTWAIDSSPGYPASAQRVYDTLIAGGMTRLVRLEYPALERTGCERHPNVHDDAALAELIERFIAARPAAWQGK